MTEPQTITRVGVWLRGKDASCSFRGVVWSSTRNTVLGQTALQAASGAALAVGASQKKEADVVTPFDVAAGTIYVGFTRNPTGAMQFGFDNTGSHYNDDNGSSDVSGQWLRDLALFGGGTEPGARCPGRETRMTDDEALELLRSLPSATDPDWPTATRIVRHRGGGGSDAWDVAVGTDIYVTKFANNPQEPQRPSPRKVVTTELVAGRVGQLFRPPVSPATTVVVVPFELIEAEPIHMSGGLAEPGPACGSLLVPQTTETKAGGQLGSVRIERLAQIVAFQALMQADDAAALVTDDGSWAYSIDHGHYFGGGSWGNHRGPAAEQPRILVIGGLDGAVLRDRQIWDPVLVELDAIGDRDLATAFVDIPDSWGCDVEFLAPLLGATSRRKERLREVVDAYC